jgi:hypothetical protein
MDAEDRFDRRSLLLAGVGVLVFGSACSGQNDSAGQPRRTARSNSSTPSDSPTWSTPTPTPATGSKAARPPSGSRLPTVEPWSASPGDLEAGVKVAAADVVEAIGSWSAGDGGRLQRARRVEHLGQPRRFGRAYYRSLDQRADAAVLEVIEAQYGGLLATTASVLVVCRQWRSDRAGRITSGGTTVDVRLTRNQPHWRVTAVHPAVLPPPVLNASPAAKAVLAEPRIELPPAARADVASGHVHESVLSAMLRLARTYRIGVSVVRSGHPTYVFGTDRISDHTYGRAFDTWRIDGHPVVDPTTPRRLVTGYMLAVAEAGSYNVGGPYAMTYGDTSFFSDATHHDHVHAGFVT